MEWLGCHDGMKDMDLIRSCWCVLYHCVLFPLLSQLLVCNIGV